VRKTSCNLPVHTHDAIRIMRAYATRYVSTSHHAYTYSRVYITSCLCLFILCLFTCLHHITSCLCLFINSLHHLASSPRFIIYHLHLKHVCLGLIFCHYHTCANVRASVINIKLRVDTQDRIHKGKRQWKQGKRQWIQNGKTL